MAKAKDLSAKLWKLQSYIGRIVEIYEPAKPISYDTSMGRFLCYENGSMHVLVGTLKEIQITPDDSTLTLEIEQDEIFWMLSGDTKIVLHF